MKRSTKILIPIAIVVVGFLVMQLLLSLQDEPSKRTAKQRPKIVETEVVKLGEVPARITAYGRIASVQPVELYSEVSGTLEPGDIPFQPAQSFARGDLLLRIDDRQARLGLNSRKSELLTALAAVLPEIKIDFPDEFQIWRDYFDACEFDKKLPPLPETKNENIKLFLSRFNVYKLYFSIRDLEIILEKHYIHAPFDGSIVSANARVGSTARMGMLLGKIINMEQLEVEIPLSAEDIQWIDRQTPVILTSSEIAGKWTGKIKRIGSTIVDRTQSVQVFIEVDRGKETALLNGVFLEARVPGIKLSNAMSVPRKALYDDKYVYLIRNGKLEYRQVSIARWETESVIVDSGLENGDTLVVEVMQGVASGMPAKSRTHMSEKGSH